ncbi:type I restriction enzyme S subunit [Zymomonas mobilis]|uniref:restriction endonuclease subunit S n=1 Tax=Zymomonas mobilis TaxID=542 RepID=UPI00026D82C5|nr:restriction endonuclease subunit S [Zymomonas mobilis]AFN57610.1 restriction modification system DNA specificity domain protein [Zymomonas mobilis subsp. mobilis ATCC 29191]TQK75371.1 type I restriction enzyme S subunit [Zymomonas mobilis]TQL14611.1 type I restriction enzyme S subunit [Zymomonas mobilis]GEB88323.1 hypothetical protein ZMO01_16630 [Zymomonas mobilis subsp. mobilis]
MLPEGWERKTVADICILQNGNGFKPHQWDTKGLPIIRIQNLNGSSNFNYFSGNPLEKWLVNPGQILFAWAGSKGVSFGPFIWNGPQGVLNQHIFKVFSKDKIDNNWLYLILRSITDKIEGQAHGFKATLVHVKKQDIDNQIVNIPPLPEQKKIAAILSTWDRAIEGTEKLLANSQQQKKALMQQLLTGKKRLPGFSGEWKKHRLSDCCHVVMGSSPKSEFYNETGEGLPLLQGNADIKNRFSCPRIFTSEITKECQLGDILLSVRAPVGTVSIALHHACIGRGISSIRVKKGNSQEFAYQYFLSIEDRWERLAQGSTFEAVNGDDIKKLTILLPPLPEQQAIAAVLTTADEEITALESDLSRLRQEKKALMQQLLTGKRRVTVD